MSGLIFKLNILASGIWDKQIRLWDVQSFAK